MHIAAAQNQKEVTANSAFDDLDLAMTNVLAIALPDLHYALALADALQNMVFRFTGALTANRGITLPQNKKLYIVSNQTAGSPSSSLVFGAAVSPLGRTAVVPPSGSTSYVILYCDGTNVDIVAGTTGGGGTIIGGVLNKTASYAASAADAGAIISFNSASAVTLTLANPVSSPTWFAFVKNIGTGLLTVSPNGLTMDSRSASLTLSQGDACMVASDGANYKSANGRTLSMAVFAPGVGSNSQVLLYMKMSLACIFPASAPESYAAASIAATGSTTYTLKKNGSSFATVNFAGAGTTGTWTQASDASFAPGDILEIDGPGTADATLANVGITLQGFRF